MNIGVYFKLGGFNTLTTSDGMIDQYATLAQAESQSHSSKMIFASFWEWIRSMCVV